MPGNPSHFLLKYTWPNKARWLLFWCEFLAWEISFDAPQLLKPDSDPRTVKYHCVSGCTVLLRACRNYYANWRSHPNNLSEQPVPKLYSDCTSTSDEKWYLVRQRHTPLDKCYSTNFLKRSIQYLFIFFFIWKLYENWWLSVANCLMLTSYLFRV